MRLLTHILNFRIWFILIVGLHTLSAQSGAVDQAIRKYDHELGEWQRSVASTEDQTILKRLISEKPTPRPVSRIIFQGISAELDKPSSMRAISWIYKHDPKYLSSKDAENKGEVIRNNLTRYHYKYPGAGELCMTISRSFSPLDMSFLEKVSSQSPSKEDQGIASLAISSALSGLGDEPELLARRLKHLKKAIQNIPTETRLSGVPATDIISDQLYVIQNLTKGRVAPLFSGLDVAGKTVQYAGAAGKVTAIVFFTEQSLVGETLPLIKSMKSLSDDLGTNMIGVYKGDLIKLRSSLANERVSWPTLYDSSGEVFKKYRVNQPSVVYVLDQAGKIQNVGEPNALINLTIRALANSTE